jgi:hypothetical protein
MCDSAKTKCRQSNRTACKWLERNPDCVLCTELDDLCAVNSKICDVKRQECDNIPDITGNNSRSQLMTLITKKIIPIATITLTVLGFVVALYVFWKNRKVYKPASIMPKVEEVPRTIIQLSESDSYENIKPRTVLAANSAPVIV